MTIKKQTRMRMTSKFLFTVNIVFVLLLVFPRFVRADSAEDLKQKLIQYNTDKVLYTDNYQKMIKYMRKQYLLHKGAIIAYSGPGYENITVSNLDKYMCDVINQDSPSITNDGFGLWGNIATFNKAVVKFRSFTLICSCIDYRHNYDESRRLESWYRTNFDLLNEQYSLMKRPEPERVRIIHDWICENFDYSKELNKVDEYDAIFGEEKTMVCQGYSLMMAKFLNMARIKSRILISATHSWNVVLLDGKWYMLDVTNDDTGRFNGSYDYLYFLRSSLKGTDYRIVTNTQLYSNLDWLILADEDYYPELWNTEGLNKYYYILTRRWIYQYPVITYGLVTVISLTIIVVSFKLLSHYVYLRRKFRKERYKSYENI